MTSAVGLQAGPCDDWCTDYQVRSSKPFDDHDRFPDGDVAMCITAASEAAWQAGGRRWPGLCTDTVRPADCGGLGSIPFPEGAGVQWVPVHGHRHGHGCDGGHLLNLGSYPVVSIQEVRERGVVVASSAYEVRDWTHLVRVDGGRWPCCYRARDSVPVLEVDLTFGQAPPALGVIAAVAIARQILAAFDPDGDCQVDKRAISKTREGVTVELQGAQSTGDSATVFENLPEVAAFIGAHNPNRLRRRSRFLSGHARPGVHRSTFP